MSSLASIYKECQDKVKKFYANEHHQSLSLERRKTGLGGSHSLVTYPPLVCLESNAVPNSLAENIPYEIDPSDDIDLYIHYPPCEWSCTFCHYSTTLQQHGQLYLEVFANTVIEEFESWRSLFSETDESLDLRSIYIGGGTGFGLNYSSMEKILEVISPALKNEAHLCIESSTVALCDEAAIAKLDLLKQHKLDRISIGVQTLDDKILSQKRRSSNIVNGYSTAEQFATNAVFRAQEYVGNINVDLMQDLSEDYSLATLTNDLEWFVNCGADSMTLYVTRFHPGSLEYKHMLDHRLSSEKVIQSVSLRMAAAIWLKEQGYQQEPGGRFSLAKNVDIYKESRGSQRALLLGLGPSAYSRLGKDFFRNEAKTPAWVNKVNEKGFGASSYYRLDDKETNEGEIIDLIHNGGSTNDLFELLANTNHPSRNKEIVNQLFEINILLASGDSFALSELGRALEDEVCFLFYSENSKALVKELYAESRISKSIQ